MDNRARVYVYRPNSQPFIVFGPDGTPRIVIAVITTVLEPVIVKDSLNGEGCYSIQAQCNMDTGEWAQAVFQFFNKDNPFADFQVYEALAGQQQQSIVHSSNDAQNPLPHITGLDAGFAYTLQFKDDGKKLYAFGAIQDPSGNVLWQSGDIPFSFYGHLVDLNAVSVGFGGGFGSVANFTGGKFEYQIQASPAYSDLQAIQPMIQSYPFLEIPFLPTTRMQTTESSNLGYKIVSVDAGGVGFESV